MRVLDILFGPGVGSHDADGLTAPWTNPLVRQTAAALLRCYLDELQHTPRCSAGTQDFRYQATLPVMQDMQGTVCLIDRASKTAWRLLGYYYNSAATKASKCAG